MQQKHISLFIALLLLGSIVVPEVGAAPVVNSLSTSSGSENGGTLVTATGTGFETGAIVEVGSNLATAITVASSTSLSFKTPVGAGTQPIKVTNPGGAAFTSAAAFTYIASPDPTVTSVSPGSGSSVGGETITIVGTNFHVDPAPIVTFDGTGPSEEAIVTSVTSTVITVIAPPGMGVTSVSVKNPTGSASPANAAYNYVAASPLTVSNINPISGTADGGNNVVISGTNFAPGIKVVFGSTPADSVIINSASQLTVVAPQGVAATPGVTMHLTNPGSAPVQVINGYTYTAAVAPTLSSVSPTSGPELGGLLITLTGSGFHEDAEVTVAGVPAANVKVLSGSTITAQVPAGTVGTTSVAVKNPSTSAVPLASSFTYVDSVRITDITPGAGPTSPLGTTPPVVITGDGFTSSVRVFFGSVEAVAPTVTTPGTEITVKAPRQAQGTVDVVVYNAGGHAARASDAYTYAQSAAPTLTGLSPATGDKTGGTPVTITGSGFLNQSGFLPIIKFGTTVVAEKDILSVTDGTIRVVSPLRVDTSSTDAKVTITVTNQGAESVSGKCTATVVACFTYTEPAGTSVKITSMNTTMGQVNHTNGGYRLTITGENFTHNSTVKVGSIAAKVLAITPTSILVEVPAWTGSTTSRADVKVTTPANDASSTATCGTGAHCLPLVAAAAPSFSHFNTANGDAAGGQVRTIHGSGFSALTKPTIELAGKVVPMDDVSVNAAGTVITFTTPGGSPGAAAMAITNPDGKKVDVPGTAFTYNGGSAAPTISTISSPGPGTAATTALPGGEVITLTGSNFGSSSLLKPTVVVAGVTVPADDVTRVNSNMVTFKAPSFTASGTKSVILTNADGQGAGHNLRYLAAAGDIATLSSTSGQENGGNQVTITGSGFPTAGQSVLVGKGTNFAILLSGSSGSVSAQVPPTSDLPGSPILGLVHAFVSDADGQTASLLNSYTYTNPNDPTFTAISPKAGSVNGGTHVTVTGQNFFPGATVTIDGMPATGVTAASNGNSITFVTPHHTVGPVDVEITNVNMDSVKIDNGFGYVGTIGPTLNGISPSGGPAGGGTQVTVTGANFDSSATVRFGSKVATAVVNSATQITATTPSGSTGTVSVTITNSDGQAATLTNAFTYAGSPAPTISTVNPTSGSSLGGNTVTITGTNFASGMSVLFDTTTATNLTIVSSTQVTVDAPPHAAGQVNLTVKDSAGQEAKKVDAYTYNAAPAPNAVSVSPTKGSTAGGTTITITGTNFASGASVTVGGTSASNVVVTSSSISARTPGHAAGVVSVVVRNADGQFDTLTSAFTYETPAGGNTGGGTGGNTGGGTGGGTGGNTGGGTGGGTGGNTGGGTGGSTDTDAGPTPTQIKAFNNRIDVDIERQDDGNLVKFTMPTGNPADIAGAEVFARNSPWNHVVTLSASSADFIAGQFLHTGPDAKADTEYLVTAYYGQTAEQGYYGSGSAPSETDYPEGAKSDTGLPLWGWLLIFLGGILLLGLLIAIIVAASRGKDEEEDWEPGVSAAAWTSQESGWAEAPQAEPEDDGHDTHHIQCPACETRFTAVGERPLVTNCPGCGKKGVLN